MPAKNKPMSKPDNGCCLEPGETTMEERSWSMMAWAALAAAGLFEMFGVMMMNQWARTRSWRSMALLVGGFAGSFLLLTFAMRTLSMSVAYAVWTGIGASGGAILGMIFYNEPKDWKRILFIAMILGGAVGLKWIA
jgi:paired small multidrug resistance pump